MAKQTNRQVIPIVLAAAMILYCVGCYSYSGMVSPEENSTVGSEDVILKMKSGQRYKIYSPWEVDQHGILIGKGRDMVAFINTPDSIHRIPIGEIQSMSAKELNWTKTGVATGLGLLTVGLIVWRLSQPGWMGGRIM